MRIIAGLLASFCTVGLSFSALAQQVPGTSPPASSATPSDKPAVTARAAPPPAKVEITADDKRLIAQGYTLKTNKGQKVFCRLETLPNSRFERSVCSTAEEIENRRENAQESIEAARRVHVGMH
jgi:hypothetical protein